jgi:hypothetical protein
MSGQLLLAQPTPNTVLVQAIEDTWPYGHFLLSHVPTLVHSDAASATLVGLE